MLRLRGIPIMRCQSAQMAMWVVHVRAWACVHARVTRSSSFCACKAVRKQRKRPWEVGW